MVLCICVGGWGEELGVSDWLDSLLCNVTIIFVNYTIEKLASDWWESRDMQTDMIKSGGKVMKEEERSDWAKRLGCQEKSRDVRSE